MWKARRWKSKIVWNARLFYCSIESIWNSSMYSRIFINCVPPCEPSSTTCVQFTIKFFLHRDHDKNRTFMNLRAIRFLSLPLSLTPFFSNFDRNENDEVEKQSKGISQRENSFDHLLLLFPFCFVFFSFFFFPFLFLHSIAT